MSITENSPRFSNVYWINDRCTGICSALQHDTIIEGGPADFAIVEKEAERIAQQAIEELKRNQETCFPAHTGIPNWTGKFGSKGK